MEMPPGKAICWIAWNIVNRIPKAEGHSNQLTYTKMKQQNVQGISSNVCEAGPNPFKTLQVIADINQHIGKS